MSVFRPLLLVLSALPCFAATFGTVVPHTQALADLVVDEARRRLYVVNTYTNTVEVYATNVSPPRQTNVIKTKATPLSLAMSRNGRYLYVACYDEASLDIIDLNSASFSTISKGLDAKPQGVAVGFNELVVITTIGTGTGTSVLITYDPTTGKTQPLTVAPPAPVAPTLPPPNGVMYLAGKSRLVASPDGKLIIGVNMQAATRTVFVFDVASSVVLSSRVVPTISPTLAVSPDGSRFLSGPLLFDTATLAVLAQQSTVNSPYVFPATANFNVQTAQGGAAFLPDNSALLAAYNIVPTTVPASSTNASQITINSPDNLLIQMGIKLPEQLSGKMVVTSDGATAYAISQSGFMVLPLGTLKNLPLAMPDSGVALLANDQCGVTAAQNSATIPVRDIGGGRITVTVQALTATATTATVRATAKTYGADVTAQFSAGAARTLGTSPADQLLIQATEAVNIIPNVRVFQNNRNSEARGSVIPIDWGASATGLSDLLGDTTRQRIYIANPGLNRLEVFDMQRRQFLSPIPVAQLPRSMAFGNDGNTLYVASGGGEQISIVDLTKGAVTGRVLFPPLPFNANFGVITPAILASSQRGPQVIMSDGTLWKIVGDKVTPRPLNTAVFGTARSIPAPQTMVSTPEGSFVLILGGTGTAFLYSAADDDFVAARSVVPTPITGYYGPLAAGPNGQYYLVNDQVLNQALTPIGSSGTGATGGGGLPTPGGPTATGRPVAAVAAVGGSSYARFSIPVVAANGTAADTGLVEVVDLNTARTTATAGGLEITATVARAGARANVLGRSMVLDSAGTTAFVLTASGLSVIPLTANTTTNIPQVPASGVVNTGNYTSSMAPGGLISIFGANLATAATSASSPLPTVLGGACVTLNNTPLSLLATSPTQINAQLPPTLAAGRYPLIVRFLAGQAASATVQVTVAKYAPAVFVDSQGPALYHADGSRVNKDHPGKRDERLTLYATGLGVTTGGRVTVGVPAPSSPLAVTAPINLYFGNPLIKEAGIIVDWSGLLPGSIGVYQINCRIPGAHIKGDALPITLKIGGVSSSTTGNNVPIVSVE
ncbi:MAG: beta-propeller fold lactonase family protein [Candidatus Solibacter sp.]